MENIGILRTETIELSSNQGKRTHKYKIIIYNNGNFTIDLLSASFHMLQVYGQEIINYESISNNIINSFQSDIINILFSLIIMLEERNFSSGTICETTGYIYILSCGLIKIIDGINKNYCSSLDKLVFDFQNSIIDKYIQISNDNNLLYNQNNLINEQQKSLRDEYNKTLYNNKLLHKQINSLEQHNLLLQNQNNSINEQQESLSNKYKKLLENKKIFCEEIKLLTNENKKILNDNNLLHEQINLLEQNNLLLQNQINSINEQNELLTKKMSNINNFNYYLIILFVCFCIFHLCIN